MGGGIRTVFYFNVGEVGPSIGSTEGDPNKLQGATLPWHASNAVIFRALFGQPFLAL